MKRLLLVLAALVTLPLVALGGIGLSSATFTAISPASSATVKAADDWTAPTVAVQALPAMVRGTVTVTATASDADSGVASVAVQRRAVGIEAWTTICTATASPYSCSWATASGADGRASGADGTVDVRAVATDKAGNTATSATLRTVVDNTAPAVALADPGTPLAGTRTFTTTTTDAGSGVAQVVVQASTNGSTWTTLCTATAAPWSCSYDTTGLANGTYSLRAQATDRVGNTATSTVVSGRVVDNTPATVSLTDPGAIVGGNVDVTATAAGPGGVTSVTVQRSPAGAGTWTTICTDTSSPYACEWNTSDVADGPYDLRAVLVDGTGQTTTSSVVANRRVLNAELRGVDVQAVNGTGTPGRPDAGDVLTYTFSREVTLGSVQSGWNGAATSVTLRVTTPLPFFGDSTLEVAGANLGTVALGTRYQFAPLGSTTTIPGTMTASTATVDGVPRTVVRIVLGTPSSDTITGGVATMTWSPSAAVTDLLNRASSTRSVVESGSSADRDF